MKQILLSSALVLAGAAGGTALTAYAAGAPPKPATAPASKPAAKPAPKLTPPPPPPGEGARDFETVEYKFYVLSSTAAPTAEHERELNVMGAQGWRIVTPIYAGGILNSYLMMRVRPPGK
jgi:hypothetical protein